MASRSRLSVSVASFRTRRAVSRTCLLLCSPARVAGRSTTYADTMTQPSALLQRWTTTCVCVSQPPGRHGVPSPAAGRAGSSGWRPGSAVSSPPARDTGSAGLPHRAPSNVPAGPARPARRTDGACRTLFCHGCGIADWAPRWTPSPTALGIPVEHHLPDTSPTSPCARTVTSFWDFTHHLLLHLFHPALPPPTMAPTPTPHPWAHTLPHSFFPLAVFCAVHSSQPCLLLPSPIQPPPSSHAVLPAALLLQARRGKERRGRGPILLPYTVLPLVSPSHSCLSLHDTFHCHSPHRTYAYLL